MPSRPTSTQVCICYFFRTTPSRPVRLNFVWLAHLQLKCNLNFINNCKHLNKIGSALVSDQFPPPQKNGCVLFIALDWINHKFSSLLKILCRSLQ